MKRLTLWMTMAVTAITMAAQTPSVVMPKSREARTVQLKAPKRIAEQRNEYGVITAPATGEEKVYNREGGVLVPLGFEVSEGTQSGSTTLVFCDDGTVYWHHPLSVTLERTNGRLDPNIWIKGTRNGDLITFPSQVIGYSTTFHTTVSIAWGTMDLTQGLPIAIPDRKKDITFQILRDGKILELQNTDRTHVLGAFYDSDDDCYYYWDYSTKLIYDASGDHAPAVTPPANLATTKYFGAGYDATMIYDPEIENSYSIGNVTLNTLLGFDGNDAYLSNFSFYGIGCWIKGTRQADGTVVFPKEQYFKTLTDQNYDLYFYALPHGSTNVTDACDLVLTYNAATGDYTTGQDLFISYEKMGPKLDKAECLENFRLISYNDVPAEPIYNAPKGYRQISYQRYGRCLSNMVGWFNAEDVPDYTIDIAYNPEGNDLYMKSPIGAALLDVWIKATKEADGKIHVPLHQYLQKDPDYGNIFTGVFARKWVYESRYQYTYEWASDIKEITFSVDEDGYLTLDPLAEGDKPGETFPSYTYGMVRGEDEFSWCGLSDAYTIYVPIEGSETIVDDPIVEPEDDIDISALCPGEQRNDYGFITTPGTGAEYTYTRSGSNYATVGGNIDEGTQSGLLHLVETEDGYVFMQQPLSTYSKGYAATSWLKGVKRENETGAVEYVFPKGQPLSYDAYYEAPLLVYMGEYDSTDGTFMPNKRDNIVFLYDAQAQTLTLQQSSNAKPLGIFYGDDDAWVGYADYHTVLTYKSSGLIEQTVEPSWKAERLSYTITANDVEQGPVGYNAVIAFEGTDDVYLGNFSFWLDYKHEETGKYVWIKGKRRSDGSLFFPKEQYLYTYTEGGKDFDLFFYGATSPFEGAWATSDLTFTYNAASDTYTAEQDILLAWGRVSTSIPRAEQLSGAVLIRDKFDGSRPYIITEQPEGTLRTYSRSGFAFGLDNSNGMIYSEPQDDLDIDLVFSPDGKYVYMKNPVSKTLLDSWVSGTVDSDGNLHIPLFQWIDYNEDLGYGVRTAACVLVEEGSAISYYMVPNLIEMSFTLDHATGTYSLDRIDGIDYTTEAPRLIYGCYWTKDNTWTGFGDFDSVYTPTFEWDPNGITTIVANGESDTYYDFAGRKAHPSKGALLIQRGRKMIVK